jgi:hypothetical protein
LKVSFVSYLLDFITIDEHFLIFWLSSAYFNRGCLSKSAGKYPTCFQQAQCQCYDPFYSNASCWSWPDIVPDNHQSQHFCSTAFKWLLNS